MRLQSWVEVFHRSFDTTRALSDLVAIARHDRFQASDGIQAAAAEVADMAVTAGLRDVEILQFPADGAERWWTFRAPVAWTPRRAELVLVDHPDGAGRRLLAYPEQSYCLAANSAATPPGGLTAPLIRLVDHHAPDAMRDAIVLLDDPRYSLSEALTLVSAHRARGVVTVSSPWGAAADPHQVGRVELAGGSEIFAFSVTRSCMDQLARWAQGGGYVRAVVEAERASMMPVVTARLAGASDDEAMLIAHLCHPRPGANDNASGVAALIGIGRTLASLPSARPLARSIRFLWGPEFAGLAAYLSEIVGRNREPLPFAAVNIDMAGEDQRICGGPLIIERTPDHLPSWLSAVVEECVRLLPQTGRSYSGAVPCDTWAWRATPFVGASDHALLADRSVACPSVQLGHWPDRFNHSSADTLDKVDPDELRRTACVGGAAVASACSAGPEVGADIERVVLSWAAARVLECLPRVGPDHPSPSGWIDPFDPALGAQWVAHRADLAVGSVLALQSLLPSQAARHAQMVRWLQRLAADVRSLAPSVVAASDDDDDGALEASWPGPFNLRGFMERADALDRAWILRQLDAARGRAYATMLALAHAIDGRSGRRHVLRRAAFASGLAIKVHEAERFLDVLVRTGWARQINS